MSTARSLRRRLDLDLIARVMNGIPKSVPPMKRQKLPRGASTYRWYKRNEAWKNGGGRRRRRDERARS